MADMVKVRGFLVKPIDLVEKGTRTILGDKTSPIAPKVKSGLAKKLTTERSTERSFGVESMITLGVPIAYVSETSVREALKKAEDR